MSEKLNISVATKEGTKLPSGLVVPRIAIPPNARVKLVANDPASGYIGVSEFPYPVDGRFEHEVGFKAWAPAATLNTYGVATRTNGRATRFRCLLNREDTDDGTAYYDAPVPLDNDTVVFDYRGGINRYEEEGTPYSYMIEHNGSVTHYIDQWFYKRTFKATS